MVVMATQVHQTVEGFAVDQGPKPCPNMDIRGRLSGIRGAVHSNRVFGACGHLVLGLGEEPQRLVRTFWLE